MRCPQHAVSLDVISPQLPSSTMHNSAAVHVQHAATQPALSARCSISMQHKQQCLPTGFHQCMLHLQPEVTCLYHTVTVVWLMQVRVTGAQYGKWGKDKYGLKPQKLDALDFYPDRLRELWRAMQEEQVCPALCSRPLLCCWPQCGHLTIHSCLVIHLTIKKMFRDSVRFSD